MFKLTQLVHFAPGCAFQTRARVTAQMERLCSAPGVVRGFANATSPGTLNGGDYIWHLQFADQESCRRFRETGEYRAVEAELNSEAVSHIDRVLYAGQPQGGRAPGLRHGVYRTLLLSATRPGATDRLEQFARETLAMPHYIHAIGNWQLSRVEESAGARVWTHVWEQEYACLADLQGPYMLHPYHWAHVDRWFDWESPDWIVDRHMCHTFCPIASSVLAPEAR